MTTGENRTTTELRKNCKEGSFDREIRCVVSIEGAHHHFWGKSDKIVDDSSQKEKYPSHRRQKLFQKVLGAKDGGKILQRD